MYKQTNKRAHNNVGIQKQFNSFMIIILPIKLVAKYIYIKVLK